MKRYIITTHTTADGKWQHTPHPEYGVFRSESTAERKLTQMVAMGRLPTHGIGMGTIEETEEKLPFTSRHDREYPLTKRELDLLRLFVEAERTTMEHCDDDQED